MLQPMRDILKNLLRGPRPVILYSSAALQYKSGVDQKGKIRWGRSGHKEFYFALNSLRWPNEGLELVRLASKSGQVFLHRVTMEKIKGQKILLVFILLFTA